MPASFFLVVSAICVHLEFMQMRWLATWWVSCVFATGADTGAQLVTPKLPKKAELTKNKPAGLTPIEAKNPSIHQNPGVEDAIPAVVKALGEPAMMNFPAGIEMAVSASTDKVQAHVNQGMNHLHGGWEFEASRHFAAAMREDPECLLAHWGMLICLLTPTPETASASIAVTSRMLDLVDQGKGSELERGYCYGLIKYMESGPVGAANAFRKVSEKFPNDLQASIFTALFSRGGYDEFGSCTPDQEIAEKILRDLIVKFPNSPLPLNALLTIQSDGPVSSSSVEHAERLCQMSPDYAPYFHLLGHYEWRAGHHGKAATAFGRATSYYESWMRKNKVPVADCPEWVKAECYRIVVLSSKGEFETALAAAKQIAATPIEAERASSPGARLLMWDAKTLPARILMRRNLRGNEVEAQASLPKGQEMKSYSKDTLAYFWMDGLRLALEVERLTSKKDFSSARNVVEAMGVLGEAFSKTQARANRSGERALWTRGFRAYEVLASDVRGSLALDGPKDRSATAYNWYASAVDRERFATMMFPPVILTPMGARVGEYYLTVGKPKEAIESYNLALEKFPNDMILLQGLKVAYESVKLTEDVRTTDGRIESLRNE